jgi:multidrug efflux pump subunit AcrB
VSQQVGSNILEVRAGVEQALTELSHALPAGLKLTKTYDLAEFVSTAIANVRDAILVGSLLAVIVLASVGSHMPARFRYYSVVDRRVL